MKYAVVTDREWLDSSGFADVHWIGNPDHLTANLLTGYRYVFFPFYSWKVPKEITDNYECVCFHMTDVPYGRGGSPLQNLILRGHTETVISAIRMTQEVDAGPVYMKRPMHLRGSAQEIYNRAAILIKDMMQDIAKTEPTPVPQEGEAVEFKRRTPEESKLPNGADPERIYDFIRMLDADGYPRAFAEYGLHRIEFSDARLENGKVIATAVFK